MAGLSKAPDSLTARSLVKQRGSALVDQVNHIGTQIDKLQKDINSELKVRIDEVNEITEKIGNINSQILKTEVSKDTANDFRDQRNLLLDRLSKLADISVAEMQDGQLDVTLGGYYLVSKGKNFKLISEEATPGDIFCVPKLESNKTIVPVKGGIIKGLLESRGDVSGVADSQGNGTPNVKVDITFAIDLSNTSTGYLAGVQSSVGKYVEELKKRGLDYNLRLVTYDGALKSNVNYKDDAISFVNDIDALNVSTDTGNNFGNVVTELSNTTDFRTDANKYMVVFTDESI